MKPVKSHLTFQHPAPFVAELAFSENCLSAESVDWFVALLKQVPELKVNEDLCQEDWGVFIDVIYLGTTFWIGVGQWQDLEKGWLVFFEPTSLGLSDLFGGTKAQKKKSNDESLQRLINEFHVVISRDSQVSQVRWHTKDGFDREPERGSKLPDAS